MKKNNNKKIQITLFAISVISVAMIYQYFKNVQIQEMKTTKTHTKDKNDKTVNTDQSIAAPPTQKRDVASVKNPNLIIKYKDRALVGNTNIHTDFPITNKINKDWKELAITKLSQFKETDTTLKITPVKPAVYVKHQIGRYVEHVKISLTKASGITSSYEAYIDSQSGAVIQTWNQTRFEFREIASLSSKGNEFFAEKVETKASDSSL